MGFFLANRRKFALAATATLLLLIYLLSVWINIKGTWRIETDSGLDSCKTAYSQSFLNNVTDNEMWKRSRTIFQNRKKYLHEKCPAKVSFKEKPELLISEKYQVVYCGLAYSGMESLLHSPAIKTSAFKYEINVDSSVQCFSNHTAVLILQHPLERLMRLYLDKHLIQHHGKSGQLTMDKNSEYPTLFTSFEKFLEYVLGHHNGNSPWRSIYKLCQPCHVHYDLLIKQSFDMADFKYLYALFNLSMNEKIGKAFKLDHEKIYKNVRQFTSNPKFRDLLKEIKNLYQDDYEMFDFPSLPESP